MAGKPLIIAEKPSAARAIADALGEFKAHEGYLESPRYLITWALGHLVELAPPEEYDPKFKRWSLETLPIMPQFALRVIARTAPQFRLIQRLAAGAPELINACDAAREGELIFRYITQLLRSTPGSQRLWVSSLTREAIRKAWGQLKPSVEYDRLYASARCRSQGDWLVGMNLTRAFTVRFGELLSVGRVQTPTLALLVRREREIAAFRPETYWEVWAEFQVAAGRSVKKTFSGKWFTESDDRLHDPDVAAAVVAAVQHRPGEIVKAEEKPAVERPPGLYDLTTLQRDANRRLGLTAAATLKAAQSLYEAKLITYPRTDSRYLTRDMVSSARRTLAQLGGNASYRELVQGADPNLLHPGNRRVVDDAKVSDHHAIIPTGEPAGGLSAVQARVYDLIARRLIAQFYPEARYLDTEVVTAVPVAPGSVPPAGLASGKVVPAEALAGGPVVAFRSRGRQTVAPGWRVVEPEPVRSQEPARGRPTARRGATDIVSAEADDEGQTALPLLAAGDQVTVADAEARQKQTQPPKRYTEAALLGAMETAGRDFDDEALKEAMKGRGLGTPATRAAIIERLKDVGYIAPEKKSLVPTPKGHQLVDLAERIGASVLLSPELTGEWEKRIADIQSGQYEPERFMAEIRDLTAHLVELARKLQNTPSGAVAAKRAGRSQHQPAPAPAAGPKAGSQEAEEPAATAPPAWPRAGRRTAKAAAPKAAAEAGTTVGAGLSPGVCPFCRQPVWRVGRGWACGTAGCQLNIPGYLCGRVIGQPLVTALLTGRKTPLIADFVSKAGKPFSAYLLLADDGKLGFEFPQRSAGWGKGRRGRSASATKSARAAKPTAAASPRTRSKKGAAAKGEQS